MKNKLLHLGLLLLISLSSLYAQKSTVQGKVTDVNGEAVIGATVMCKGTTIGVITDEKGFYSIDAPDPASVLVFSYMGMNTVETAVKNRTVIDITLLENLLELDEVVVVGYGVQRKTDVTSAVATLKRENFSPVVTSASAMQMVQGKIPGLAVSQKGGSDPNAGVSLQVRGMTTINAGASPLIVIDGVPGGNLNSVSPNDIESVDVLRDGSAAAIYGSRGTSGVIIITTKSGRYDSKTKIEYEGNVSLAAMSRTWDVLNAGEYRAFRQSLIDSDLEYKQHIGKNVMTDYGGNTDWMEELTRTAVSHQHYLSLTSGAKDVAVAASINYRDYQGIVLKTDNRHLNGKISTNFKHFNDKLKIGLNLSYTTREGSPANAAALKQALIWNPTMTPYDADGKYTPSPNTAFFYNPVNLINETDITNKYTNLLGSAKITLTPIRGLQLTALVGTDRATSNSGRYDTTVNEQSTASGQGGYAYRKYTESASNTLELTAAYQTTINDLNLEALGGYSYERSQNEWFDQSNIGFTFNDNSFHAIGSGNGLKTSKATMNSYKGSSKLISFFGRVVLNYKDKYLMNATIRHEGSSRFGANHQWGTFPAVSLGWKLINEPFMKDQRIFDDLKVRLGYGVTGNEINVAYVNYILYQANPVYSLNDGKWEPTYSPKTNANPDLKWETKKEWNFGLDMAFLNRRLQANIDVYSRKSADLLYEYSVPVPPYLSNKMWDNIGTISNRGIEVAVNATPFQTKDFTWSLNVNGSYNKNRVDRLTTSAGDVQRRPEELLMTPLYGLYAVMTEEGQPIGNFYGWKYAGVNENGETLVYRLDDNKNIAVDENGKPVTVKWADSKGSERDRTCIGNGMPKFYANMSHTFRYKQFDLSFMLRGVFGFDILNVSKIYQGTPVFSFVNNLLADATTNESFDESSYTDRVVERGDFVKLDNITLGYTVPLKKNPYIQNIRVFGNMQNVCTFTGYSGQNPELEISGTVVGVDRQNAYPLARTFSLGVHVTF